MSDFPTDEFPKSEKQRILAGIARDTTERGEIRLKAIEIHAKLSGEFDDETRDDQLAALERTLDNFHRRNEEFDHWKRGELAGSPQPMHSLPPVNPRPTHLQHQEPRT